MRRIDKIPSRMKNFSWTEDGESHEEVSMVELCHYLTTNFHLECRVQPSNGPSISSVIVLLLAAHLAVAWTLGGISASLLNVSALLLCGTLPITKSPVYSILHLKEKTDRNGNLTGSSTRPSLSPPPRPSKDATVCRAEAVVILSIVDFLIAAISYESKAREVRHVFLLFGCISFLLLIKVFLVAFLLSSNNWFEVISNFSKLLALNISQGLPLAFSATVLLNLMERQRNTIRKLNASIFLKYCFSDSENLLASSGVGGDIILEFMNMNCRTNKKSLLSLWINLDITDFLIKEQRSRRKTITIDCLGLFILKTILSAIMAAFLSAILATSEIGLSTIKTLIPMWSPTKSSRQSVECLQSSLQFSPSSRDVKTRSKDRVFEAYFHKAKVSIGLKSKLNIRHPSPTAEIERDTFDILDVHSLPPAVDEYSQSEERPTEILIQQKNELEKRLEEISNTYDVKSKEILMKRRCELELKVKNYKKEIGECEEEETAIQVKLTKLTETKRRLNKYFDMSLGDATSELTRLQTEKEILMRKVDPEG